MLFILNTMVGITLMLVVIKEGVNADVTPPIEQLAFLVVRYIFFMNSSYQRVRRNYYSLALNFSNC